MEGYDNMKGYTVKYTAIEIPSDTGKTLYKIVRRTTTLVESVTDWTVATDLGYDSAAKIIQEFNSLRTLEGKTELRILEVEAELNELLILRATELEAKKS